MRRVLALCCAITVLLAIPPAPAWAAALDSGAVRAQMADVAEQATRTQVEIDQLQAQIPAREAAVTAERAQLRTLARAMYAQPSSPLLAVIQAPSLGEAFGQVTEMLAASGRARATQAALERNLAALRDQRAQLEARRGDLERQRADLDARYSQLVVQEEAARRASAASSAAVPVAPAPASVAAGGALTDIIRAAWAPTGRGDWAVRLAMCESTLNPNAVNRSSGAAGLFQFMPRTWAATPWHNQSPFDPVANSQAAAWLWLKYGSGQWDCSARIGY